MDRFDCRLALAGDHSLSSLSALVAILCSLGCGGERVIPQPNVLMVVIDTIRADHCSLYGYDVATTPNLDRLASKGVRFDRAYAPIPVTAPSIFSMFTSVYPVTHGCMENAVSLSDTFVTMPEVLASGGYQTYGVASSAPLSRRYGFARGFERYEDSWPVEESTEVSDPKAKRTDYALIRPAVKNGKTYLRWDRRPIHTTRHALEWMSEERDETRPLFAFVHYMDPHSPNVPAPETLAELGLDARPERIVGEQPDDRLVELYDAELRETDAAMGELIAGLKAQDSSREWLVIVVGDHGQGLNQHRVFGHGVHLYEEAMRVPLVMHWPGRIEAGGSIEAPVEMIDLFPTLLGFLGIDAGAAEMRGRNLASAILDGAPLDGEHPVFLQRGFADASGQVVKLYDVFGTKFAIRIGAWKYIVSPEAQRFELYNLEEDPYETVNLISQHPERLEELRSSLAALRKTHTVTSTPRNPENLSQDEIDALRALGYME